MPTPQRTRDRCQLSSSTGVCPGGAACTRAARARANRGRTTESSRAASGAGGALACVACGASRNAAVWRARLAAVTAPPFSQRRSFSCREQLCLPATAQPADSTHGNSLARCIQLAPADAPTRRTHTRPTPSVRVGALHSSFTRVLPPSIARARGHVAETPTDCAIEASAHTAARQPGVWALLRRRALLPRASGQALVS